MKYILGIDQGGTKTLAALADENGNILGVGQAPGGYHAITGVDYAIHQVKVAAEEAVRVSGLAITEFAAIGAGMTGADFHYEYELLQNALSTAFNCPFVSVVNDCMIALRAGTTQKASAVICAGTGLNCGIHAPDGREFVFGYYIDDCWQGGAAIARQALISVFEAEVGLGPTTQLTKRFLDYFEAPSVEILLQKWVSKEIATDKLKYLAEDVDECAADNDIVSLEILSKFGKACARYVLAGLKQFEMQMLPVEIVLSGSIFKSRTSLLQESVTAAIHKGCANAVVVAGRYEPVVGGVILALENLPEADPQACVEAIESSAILWKVIRTATE